MKVLSYKTWSVSRAAKDPLLRFLLEGLQAGGCRIIFYSQPNEAPFLITYETASGDRQGALWYAFLANSKPTKNRFRIGIRCSKVAILTEHGPTQAILRLSRCMTLPFEKSYAPLSTHGVLKESFSGLALHNSRSSTLVTCTKAYLTAS